MRILGDNNREVGSDHSIAINLDFLHNLEALKAEHGAPEDQSDNQVKEDNNHSNQLLRNLNVLAANINAGGGARGQDEVLPVLRRRC